MKKGHSDEKKACWDIFFDLHGVLVDVTAVGRSYESYLVEVLAAAGITRDKAATIHSNAFKQWIIEFRRITDGLEGISYTPEKFMYDMRKIDRDWEEYILNFVPEKNKQTIIPMLITSSFEYEAMARIDHSIVYPEVIAVLEELEKNTGLSMHVASSASSQHVKGAMKNRIGRFFKTVIGYDTVKAPKKAPSGQYFRNMLAITGADPTRSIFVGDSVEEALLALGTGMKFIKVQRDQYLSENEIEEQEYSIIYDLAELPFLVAKMLLDITG